MATATKQLEAIYQEISERFSGDPRIIVTPLDGDPPEKYEITYHTTGVFKDDSGEVQEKDSHSITISIPFGFPHFPPSCKPKSTIFHPDFDPAAICIGDFWEKDRSISDLISHIGQMISGNVYSTSNAFNEEAAKWYQDNRSRLPFDTFEADPTELMDSGLQDSQPSDDDITLLLDDEEDSIDIIEDFELEPDLPSAAEPAIDISPGKETAGVDTLDESFLDSDYDFLGEEKGDPATEELDLPKSAIQESEEKPEVDVDRFQLMARQKRYYELDMELGDLPGHQQFNGRDNLAVQAAEALKLAREIYNQGTDFEHQGNPGKALNAFRQVEATCSDYPGLQEDIDRTTQAKELLGDWTEPAGQPAYDERSDTFDDEQSIEEDLPPLENETLTDLKASSRTFFEETARKTSKIIPFAVGIAVLLGAGTIGVYYYLGSSTLDKAQNKFEECQAVLKQNRFSEAERQCEMAIDIAKQIQFFKGGARDELIEEIQVVLNSQGLTEGLAGNLLLDGKYLPKKVVKTILAFRYFMDEGDKHFADQSWQQAVSSYQQALALTKENDGVDPKVIFTVEENLKMAQFKVLFRTGTEFIEREKWVLATQELNKALEQVKELNIENKAEIIDEVSAKLAEISLATSKEEGDIAFSQADWKSALIHYKKALSAVKKSYSPDDPEVKELTELVIKAELYDTINSGKDAFTNADWDEAISSYEQAIEILESNREILRQASTEENRKKLARVMLQASVIRDKQNAARFLKNGQYEEAIGELQSIIKSISSSTFNQETEFSAVVKDAKASIDQAKVDMLLADKIAYLEEHFKELFTAQYTVSSAEALTEPTVIFDKQIGDKLIFKLQCIEVGRGRPLKLVMKYAHDLKTGKWSFYSSSQ